MTELRITAPETCEDDTLTIAGNTYRVYNVDELRDYTVVSVVRDDDGGSQDLVFNNTQLITISREP